MMHVDILLFGAFRQFQSEPRLRIELPDRVTVGELRAALADHAARHWQGCPAGLLPATAIASEDSVLEDSATVDAGSTLALLPPVSGG